MSIILGPLYTFFSRLFYVTNYVINCVFVVCVIKKKVVDLYENDKQLISYI